MRYLIRKSLFILIPVLFVFSCKRGPEAKKNESPERLFPGLFEAVQSSGIFPDSKTFPDCRPRTSPGKIMQAYDERKKRPGFELEAFVSEHFVIPIEDESKYRSDKTMSVETHVNALWDELQRPADKKQKFSSLIELPNSYIVPGGRFREVYYWDSYFTMLGLVESGREQLAENMVNNLAFLVRTYGLIPNGNRTYYLTRSQPPFFSCMLQLLMDVRKASADSLLKANKDVLEKEYAFWMKGEPQVNEPANHVVMLDGQNKMNRFFDSGSYPRAEAYIEDVRTAASSGRDKLRVYADLRAGAESGWDYSSRWLADMKSLNTIVTTDIIPVDLNCLLFNLENLLADAYLRSGDKAAADHMQGLARTRRECIMRYCWDAGSSWFQDYNWKEKRVTGVPSIAGMFPLYFKMISASRADSVESTLKKVFLKAGGVVTTVNNTGQQWDSPNGWAPLQWISYAAMINYNKSGTASEIAKRWLALNEAVFRKTGKMLEKYNVEDTSLLGGGGEYENQDGFGWTNGVYLRMKKAERLRTAGLAAAGR